MSLLNQNNNARWCHPRRSYLIWVGIHGIVLSLVGCAGLDSEREQAHLFEKHLTNPTFEEVGLRTYMEAELSREFEDWPLRQWDLSNLTLAARYFNQNGVGSDGRPTEVDDLTQGMASREWGIRSRVRSALLDYVAAERSEGLLRELQALQTTALNIVQVEFAGGLTGRAELAVLRLRLAEVSLLCDQSKLAKLESQDQLALSLNVPLSSLTALDIDVGFSSAVGPAVTDRDLRRYAFRIRSEMIENQSSYLTAEREFQEHILAISPQVEVVPACSWDSEKALWIPGDVYNLPKNVRTKKAVAELNSHRLAAAARLLDLQSRLVNDLERRHSTYVIRSQVLDRMDEIVAAHQEQVRAVQAQYKAGLSEALDLLVTKMHTIAAQMLRLEAAVARQVALGALEDVIQWPAELIESEMLSQTPRLDPTREGRIALTR